MTDNQRRFLLEVDDRPYDKLFQDHSAQTKGECKYNDWAYQRADGSWGVTPRGTLAMGADL